MTDRLLCVGDVVEGSYGRVPRLYVVIGFSPYGKTRFRRVDSGTELTTWWASESDMPRHYRVVARADEASLERAA